MIKTVLGLEKGESQLKHDDVIQGCLPEAISRGASQLYVPTERFQSQPVRTPRLDNISKPWAGKVLHDGRKAAICVNVPALFAENDNFTSRLQTCASVRKELALKQTTHELLVRSGADSITPNLRLCLVEVPYWCSSITSMSTGKRVRDLES